MCIRDSLDTHAGQAWVGLRVMLNPVKLKTNEKPQKYRSPSYFRRQERRKAARTQSAAERSQSPKSAAEVQETENITDAEEATVSESSKVAENSKQREIPSEKEVINCFRCETCNFRSETIGMRGEENTNNLAQEILNIEQIDGNATLSSSIQEDNSCLEKDTNMRNNDQSENEETEREDTRNDESEDEVTENDDESKDDQSENEDKATESEETENNQSRNEKTEREIRFAMYMENNLNKFVTWWGYEHEKSLISKLDDVHYQQKLALVQMLSKLRSKHIAPELHEMMTESEMIDEVKYCFSKTIFGSEIKEVVMAANKAFIEDRSSAMRSRQKLPVQKNLKSVM